MSLLECFTWLFLITVVLVMIIVPTVLELRDVPRATIIRFGSFVFIFYGSIALLSFGLPIIFH